MPNQPSAALRAAMKRDAVAPSEDRLEKVRGVLRQARDLDKEIATLEERTKEAKAQVLELKQKTLPDLYDEVGIDNLGLAPEGNLPGYDCKMAPYYHANIGAEWPEEDRAKAFAYLEKQNADSLIKFTYVVLVPKGNPKFAKKVEATLKKLGADFETKLSVPWNTLTAWLKEQVTKHQRTPDLDLIGGTVGRVVTLKERNSNG